MVCLVGFILSYLVVVDTLARMSENIAPEFTAALEILGCIVVIAYALLPYFLLSRLKQMHERLESIDRHLCRYADARLGVPPPIQPGS